MEHWTLFLNSYALRARDLTDLTDFNLTQKAAIKWEESLSLLKLSRAWAGSNEVQIADIAEIFVGGRIIVSIISD